MGNSDIADRAGTELTGRMDSDPANIRDLIHAARQQDRDAMSRLLDAYRNYLVMLARLWLHRAVPPELDSSDIVQEVQGKAYEKFGQFRGESEQELTAWLRQILARTIVSAVRRHGAQMRDASRQVSLEGMVDESHQRLESLVAASGTTPDEAAQRRELSVVLADALAALTADHREVIVLRSLQGCEWMEVAAKMNRSADAVRMLWTRALKELRPHIEAAQ